MKVKRELISVQTHLSVDQWGKVLSQNAKYIHQKIKLLRLLLTDKDFYTLGSSMLFYCVFLMHGNSKTSMFEMYEKPVKPEKGKSSNLYLEKVRQCMSVIESAC